MSGYIPPMHEEHVKKCERIKNINRNLSRILQIDLELESELDDATECICWHPIRVAAICDDIDVLREELESPEAERELHVIKESYCGHGLTNYDLRLSWPELSPRIEDEFKIHEDFYHHYMTVKHSLAQYIRQRRNYRKEFPIALRGHVLSCDVDHIDLRELSDLDFKYSMYYRFEVCDLFIQNYDNLDERFQ